MNENIANLKKDLFEKLNDSSRYREEAIVILKKLIDDGKSREEILGIAEEINLMGYKIMGTIINEPVSDPALSA